MSNTDKPKTLAQLFASACVKTKNAADKVKVMKGAAFAALMLHLQSIDLGDTFDDRLEGLQSFYRDATNGRSGKDKNTIGTKFRQMVGPEGSFQFLAAMLNAWPDKEFQRVLEAQMANVERDGDAIGKKDPKENFLQMKAISDAAKEWRDRAARLADVPARVRAEAEKISTFSMPAMFLMKEGVNEDGDDAIIPVENAGEFADSCEEAAEKLSKAAQRLRELAEQALHSGNPVPLLAVNKRGEAPSITVKSDD